MDEDTKETLRQPVAQRLAEDDIELQPDPDPDPHPDLSLAEGQLLTSVEPAMPTTTSDKAVSTCGITDLEDYQRAVTYEIVFNSLLEKKMQAMKRDCEERKRNKRLKRKSIGRIFMAKRLFSSVDSRKSSSISETGEENVHARTAPSTPQKLSQIAAKSANKEDDPQQMLSQQWQSPDTEINRKSLSHRPSPQLSRTRPKAKSITATTYESPKEQDTTQADDSITSTLSNSSGRIGNRSVLVLAQTHTHMQAENPISSSSGDSKQATSGQRTVANVPITKQDLTCDTASLASGYDNGPGARLNTNTIGDDSLASLRDSIESLSFASSRCTVSFGATEVIPEVIDNAVFERVRAAKRQRVLEAKSISAQCSPILPPRHIIKTMVHAPMSPPITKALTMPPAEPAAVPSHIDITEPLPPKTASPTPATITLGPSGTTRYLPNQFSYTDSLFESRNISRQNTSEESANLTLSTLLNQSDSLSLHASPSPTGDFRVADFTLSGRPVRTVDRFKSKSTGLLEATGNGRTRPPPPLPPPPFETAQPSPATSRSPISDARTKILPIEQLKQFHIASNAKKQHPFECYTATTPKHWLTESLTGSGQITTTAVAETTKFSHTKPLHVVTIGTAAMTPTTTPNPLLGKQYSKVDTSSQLDASSTSTLVGQPVNDVVLQSELHEAMTATEGDDIVTTALLNGAFIRSSSGTADAAKLLRMTSTSTGSSIGPTGCCTTTKTSSRLKEKQRFKPTLPTGQSGSDDEYRKKKRKYKRYHRCSDPVLVYPTSSGLQHCILSMPPNDPIQYPYTEDYAYDMQLQMESDKNDDLEKIVPSDSTKRKHHKHRHHRHKKRHRHKKPKILVQDLETQEVKVIDPDDLPQRARWTIIATACLLLLMCLMLVGITLRMAPIIDDMDFEMKCEIGTMGKHRNATQNGLFLEFMEANTDLAKGYTKRDKVVVDALWRELADGLNGAGPPQKDVNGWKKIWTEWKSEIKKKLGHNKVEAHATGGGPFSQYQLTQTEESIVRLCGMKTTVEGVSGVSLGGDMSDIDEFLNDDMPTTSHKKSAKHAICSTPKRRTETTADRLTTFLDGDLELKKQLNEKLDSLAAGGKENGSSLKRIYRAIEKGTESITNVLEEIKNEYVRANNKMLLAVQEKNELKKQQLELELLKYQMQNRN